jgi:hypothetical protein
VAGRVCKFKKKITSLEIEPATFRFVCVHKIMIFLQGCSNRVKCNFILCAGSDFDDGSCVNGGFFVSFLQKRGDRRTLPLCEHMDGPHIIFGCILHYANFCKYTSQILFTMDGILP